MDRLPTETWIAIFELAVADNRQTGCSLCLVDRATQQLARPILYKHISLDGTGNVVQFNAMIKSRPQLGNLIHGMTLLDHSMGGLARSDIHDALYSEARNCTDWVRPWKVFLRYLSVLSRQHNLKTLVISYEASVRLMCFRGDIDGIAWELKRSDLQLDHLVVSHPDLCINLSFITTKNLTVYGCDIPVLQGYFRVNPHPSNRVGPLRSKRLQTVKFFLGNNHNHFHGLRKDVQVTQGLKWANKFASNLQRLCEEQEAAPNVSIFLHVNTQEVIEHLQSKLQGLDCGIQVVGSWGNTTDTSQRVAELESFAAKGWTQRRHLDSNSQSDVANRKEKPESTTGWQLRPPPNFQWCGCLDTRSVCFTGKDENSDDDESDFDGLDDDERNYRDLLDLD